MNPFDPLERQSANVEQFCGELARTFRVRSHEIAVYWLQSGMLRFLYPVELRKAGVIPLTSSSMVARTASSKRSECQNSFASIRHSSVFETVKLSGAEGMEPAAMTIQKMISTPILSSTGEVAGVIQVSRKGITVPAAGPDFTPEDLRSLEQAAQVLGKVLPKFLDAV
jgi:hypothetical protein